MTGTKEERLKELNQWYPVWEPHSLWTMFCRVCRQVPDAVFVITEDHTYTYQETERASAHMAKCLLALGVRKGSHVALLLHNCEEYIFLTLALARLGAVKIAVNPKVGREELQYVLDQADAEFLFSRQVIDDDFFCQVPRLRQVLFCEKNGICRSRYGIFNQDIERECLSVTDEMLERHTCGPEISGELFDITFTSGSTSRPKGVMITHDMLLRTAYGSCLSRLFEPGRRICVPVPLYHNLGYVEGFLTAMLVGGSLVMATRQISPNQLFHMLVDHQCNDLITVPTQMMDFFDQVSVQREDFASLHAVYCSASTPPEWIWRGIREKFGVTDVVAAFGMTEVTASTLQTRPEDPEDYVVRYVGTRKPGGVAGVPEYDGYQVVYCVRDPGTGKELPPGQPGELCCKGTTVMKGYYNQDALNRTLFDREGWFHTGDMGYFDQNGYLVFVGRASESFKTRGELVIPRFLDSMIGKCSRVRAVSVVGVPDERCGEVGAAFLDVEDPSMDTCREIYYYCRSVLASFQVPKYFILSRQEEWPRTASGKNPRYQLRDIAIRRIRAGDAVEVSRFRRED